MYKQGYHIHFVGIGGIGMSGIAELSLMAGYKVSGSDIVSSDITKRLERLGATIYKGHGGKNISNADLIVVSSAIKENNPEVNEAHNLGIPVIQRAEMLAELMKGKYGIAIAGAHGKTTTTSITASVLIKGGLAPTVSIGGEIKKIGTNAIYGKGRYVVFEADESDGSLLKFSPTIAVVTNIDEEHLDYYNGIEDIKKIFIDFIHNMPFYGFAVLCADNEHIGNILPKINKRYIKYGISEKADISAKDISFPGEKSEFTVCRHEKEIGRTTLNLAGIHNVYNALAAISVGLELDIPFSDIKEALKSTMKVGRRLEFKGKSNGVTVIDDYGHHPAEIKTTLAAAKKIWHDKRLVVVFQPHRYTRTKALFDEFTNVFYDADILVILPIYSAGETKIEEINSLFLHEKIFSAGYNDSVYQESMESAIGYLKKNLMPDDVLITLGAGDVWKIGEAILR